MPIVPVMLSPILFISNAYRTCGPKLAILNAVIANDDLLGLAAAACHNILSAALEKPPPMSINS